MCRVEELTLINEHLQEQLAESRGNSDRLSGDVHRLSVSLSAAQNRASEMESEHRERLTVRTISQTELIFCRPSFTISFYFVYNLTHLHAFNKSHTNSPLLAYLLAFTEQLIPTSTYTPTLK